MNYVKLGTVLLVISLAGCIWNIDKPPPPAWTYYTGNGATKDEINSAFLECGYPVPGDFNDFPQEVLSQLGYERSDTKKEYAAFISLYYCMKNAGLPMRKSTLEPCERDNNVAKYAICQPGAVIPVRSVENRLNSPYCKITPKSRFCQPDYDPKVSRENMLNSPYCKIIAPKSFYCQPGYDTKTRRFNCELYPNADICQPGYDPKAPKPKSPAQ